MRIDGLFLAISRGEFEFRQVPFVCCGGDGCYNAECFPDVLPIANAAHEATKLGWIVDGDRRWKCPECAKKIQPDKIPK
jgi:hypothetical protein